MRRTSEAAQRALDRRQHEDSAPRLHIEVPRLLTLRLDILDGGPVAMGGIVHVRHVVVAAAPALFDIPCADRHCKDGGHDVTWEIMRSLRANSARFEGEHECSGSVGAMGTSRCNRVMKYTRTATYG